MRKAFVAILALPLFASAQAADAIAVEVRPQVELVSIIFRLAGNPEYSQGRVPAYIADADKHFGPFLSHEAVTYARELRATSGVSYDAPMSLAVHVTVPPALAPRLPLDPLPPNIDSRWTAESADLFLSYARDFAAKADFEAFWKEHAELYERAETALAEVVARDVDAPWFDAFFGAKRGAKFVVVPALVNGGSCYGPRFEKDNRQTLYSILGVWMTDSEGLPLFDESVVPTIVHEFAHSYVNPLADANAEALGNAAEKLFAASEDAMRRQAYGSWQTLVKESLVRACVVRYIDAHQGSAAAVLATSEEVSRGFIWMPGLVQRLSEYELSRDRYATLEQFMPEIIACFDEAAKGAEAIVAEREAGQPNVLRLEPANGAQDVDPATAELRVTFDRSMEDGFSWCGGGINYPELPEGKKPFWTDHNTTCVLPVRLRPGWDYVLYLNAPSFPGFRSRDGEPLEPLEYRFSTME